MSKLSEVHALLNAIQMRAISLKTTNAPAGREIENSCKEALFIIDSMHTSSKEGWKPYDRLLKAIEEDHPSANPFKS